eukprot:8071845-Ditylum_brightwellii.AAC.1
MDSMLQLHALTERKGGLRQAIWNVWPPPSCSRQRSTRLPSTQTPLVTLQSGSRNTIYNRSTILIIWESLRNQIHTAILRRKSEHGVNRRHQ